MKTRCTDKPAAGTPACGQGVRGCSVRARAGRGHGPADYATLARRCPGLAIARGVDPDFADLLGRTHHKVWGGGGVLPLKVKYLMALATAVTGREKQRAVLEARKALAHGATDDEVRETLELAVWLAGSPRLVDTVAPILRMLDEPGPDAEA